MRKDGLKSSIRSRTEELRREIEATSSGWRRPLKTKTFALSVAIWSAFVLVVGLTALWVHQQPLVDHGRVMRETRTVHAEFLRPDVEATATARSAARTQTPRVYNAVSDALEDVRKSLEGLPAALSDADAIEKVEPSLQKQFGLTADGLRAVRQFVEAGGKTSQAWLDRVARLHESLSRTPLLDAASFQLEQTSSNAQLELRLGGDTPSQFVPKSTVGGQGRTVPISVESAALVEELKKLAERAGFSGAALDVVAARLIWQARPTFTFDKDATLARQNESAAKVEPKTLLYPAGEVLYRRGEVLSSSQLEVLRSALENERKTASPLELWLQRVGVFGLVGAVAAALAGYTVMFVPRVRRNPMRIAAIATLMGVTAVAACYATVTQPKLIAFTAVAPTVFVAVMLCVAYDRRVALAYGCLHGILVCTALEQPIGVYATMICGVGAAVWRLREVRDRDALFKMGLWVGAALAAGTFITSILQLPATTQALKQAAWDAALAGFGGLLVAGITLFILPMLEKLFDITTGMTLVELRDPKQPLLRQLQQRAPGTYNHSLNLASLAEAASEAIGASGLLAYVGALYHDIGKMNKPDYFVENQVPGFNRHDKLSPAMSLLVIVGHVKDGMELAREFNLPRPLWHFIESHHGTTLVEYFYHRARKKAEKASAGGSEVEGPTELEYRYPGPKPRTKEAAIIMLCDAVESASRAMTDPTPARIEATVRAIANKRLMDGQFDDCDLTLRELNIIVETVSKTLASIYHGRIAYPSLPAPAAREGLSEHATGDTKIITASRAATPAASGTTGSGAMGGPPSAATLAPSERPAGIVALSNPIKAGEPGQ